MIVKLTLDRIEDKQAVLLTNDKETVFWPLSKMPNNSKEGDEFYFQIVDTKGSNKDLAKELLNEILDA